MADFVVIRIQDDENDLVNEKSTYVQLLKLYDSLDHTGKVSVLACAYTQKIRMKKDGA